MKIKKNFICDFFWLLFRCFIIFQILFFVNAFSVEPACAASEAFAAAFTAAGFIIAAQAIVPAANFASFLVGPDPKNIFGSTYNIKSVKGHVSVILSDPPCKEDNARTLDILIWSKMWKIPSFFSCSEKSYIKIISLKERKHWCLDQTKRFKSGLVIFHGEVTRNYAYCPFYSET